MKAQNNMTTYKDKHSTLDDKSYSYEKPTREAVPHPNDLTRTTLTWQRRSKARRFGPASMPSPRSTVHHPPASQYPERNGVYEMISYLSSSKKYSPGVPLQDVF